MTDGAVAAMLLDMAQTAARKGEGVKGFLARCRVIEKEMRARAGVASMRELPKGRAWIQAKSDIKRAWNFTDPDGNRPFNPLKYNSVETLKREYLAANVHRDEGALLLADRELTFFRGQHRETLTPEELYYLDSARDKIKHLRSMVAARRVKREYRNKRWST